MQDTANRSLNIEIAPSLTDCKRGQVGPGAVGQRRDAGGRLDLEPNGDKVISAACRARRQLLLEPHKCPVPEPAERALAGRRVADIIRRRRNLDLIAVAHDQVQALAAVDYRRVRTVAGVLLGRVEAEPLLEHASRRDQRAVPGRLVCAHLSRPRLPSRDEVRYGIRIYVR